MIQRCTVKAGLLLILCSFVRTASAQSPPVVELLDPAITFEASAVVVSGVTPGQAVAWFSVAREATEGGSLIVRREQVTATSSVDGVARFELTQPVPPRSIWAAVDLTTGKFALGTPEDFPLVQNVFKGDTIQADSTGKYDQFLFQDSGTMMEYFVARPGVGAWASTVWDGAIEDTDGLADGKAVAGLAGMEAAGASPAPPDGLVDGDVVIVIDPNEMQVSVTQAAASEAAK